MLQAVQHERAAFLNNGGECGRLIAGRDWTDSLGPVEGWPQSLKTATAILLRSPVPMVMLWGEDGIMLYNDAYSVFAGGRHPELLGSKVREGWPEVADFNDHVMKVGLAGGTLQFRDQELTLYRTGKPEQVWMNLDYSPVAGENGEPAGVLAVVIETTERLRAEHELRAREERLRFFDALSEAIRDLTRPEQVMACTAQALGRHLDASVVAYADMGADEDQMNIRGDWAADGSQSIVGTYSLGAFGKTANRELRNGRPFITFDTLEELGPEEGKALLDLGLGATVCMPYFREGRLTALMAVHSKEPRQWTNSELSLIAEATDRSWAHVERVRAEVVLRESEDRFRNMADNTPVMMWVTDQSGNCTYLNRRWYEFTGQEQHEGEGLGWIQAVHPEDRPLAEAVFLGANAGQDDYKVEFRLRRADGTYRWTLDAAAARFDSAGKFLGYVGSVVDIDERREAEEAIRNSEQRLRLATAAANIGTWDFDPITGALRWDQRCKELFGMPPEAEVTYELFLAGLHPDDRETADAAVQAALAPGGTGGYSVTYRTVGLTDNQVRSVAANGGAVFDDSGEEPRAVRFIGTVIDITDRMKAEQHQRLLIDELSHRAKNLLAIIQSVAQQSFKGARDPADMLRSFEGRLGALAAAHGVLTREKWEAAPIRRVICDTITAVKSDDHRLELDGPDLMVPPKTGVSLAMAIHELVTNALKYGSFSGEDGRVLIRWGVEEGRLKLEWREEGGPPVSPPERRGFGSRMIERGLAAELDGQVRIDFRPEGVVCTVDAPMPEIA
ncbi:MAG TPA: PAS domain S-box protein [Sphingomicrobium sp.]|nr:PAS domain S-box protein [Sphingomicrobium sp.]